MDMAERFKKYEVKADSVADFIDRYGKRDRYAGRGEDYLNTVIASHTSDLAQYGYTIISHHDSVTGEIVSFYG